MFPPQCHLNLGLPAAPFSCRQHPGVTAKTSLIRAQKPNFIVVLFLAHVGRVPQAGNVGICFRPTFVVAPSKDERNQWCTGQSIFVPRKRLCVLEGSHRDGKQQTLDCWALSTFDVLRIACLEAACMAPAGGQCRQPSFLSNAAVELSYTGHGFKPWLPICRAVRV